MALATNSVTVNGGTADRKVEYFHRELPVANANGPLWTNVTVVSGGVTNSGGLVFPKNSQARTYDEDGNLTFDGEWAFEWDGENRLKAMTMTNVTGIANSNRLRLEFAYDFMNRRVQKIVSRYDGAGFVPHSTNRFVYDGWNLLAVLDPEFSILQSFTWGQDLSGTMQGAGGIGGLLMVATGGTNCFAAYDGNGNITALIGGDKSTAARYEYSPYGELLRTTGPLARANPFRWSTKFWDKESALVYYGHRYYSPTIGRWISRDPVAEQGGINLYEFVLNSPIYSIDPHGQLVIQFSIGSFLQSVLRGALISGAITGAIGTINKVAFGNGTWTDVGKSVLKAMVVGGITGGTGSMMNSLAKALTPTGAGGALSPGAGAFIGGANAAIGYTVGQGLFGDASLKEQLNSTAGIVGFTTAVAVGAFLGWHGAKYEEIESGGLSLDIALEMAGAVGNAAALTAYDTMESIFDMLQGYVERIE